MIHAKVPKLAGSIVGVFTVCDPATGALITADALPTADVYHPNTAALVESLTVFEVIAGFYHAKIAVASNYTWGISYPWIITATVGGTTRSAPGGLFKIVPASWYGTVAVNGGNTATDFELSIYDETDNNISGGSDVTDNMVGSLLTFLSGSNIHQVRKITAWNATTNIVTVEAAYSNIPSSGDAVFVISK